MASEPRACRLFLVAKMLERWAQSLKDSVVYRIVASPTFADTLYVFIFVPNAFKTIDEYREIRQSYLRDYCILVFSNNRNVKRVIGIATDADDLNRTFEALLLQGDRWTPEMDELAKAIASELDVSGKGQIHRITDLIPEVQQPHRSPSPRRPRTDGKIGRNDPCPCQSGKKFKRCCLPRMRD